MKGCQQINIPLTYLQSGGIFLLRVWHIKDWPMVVCINDFTTHYEYDGGEKMAQEWAKRFYNSKAWIKCRELYKQEKNGLCERCLKKGKYNAGEEVHHKIWLTPQNINNPNITLSFDNLELLCSSCHTYEHVGKFNPVREGLMFNERGELVECDV